MELELKIIAGAVACRCLLRVSVPKSHILVFVKIKELDPGSCVAVTASGIESHVNLNDFCPMFPISMVACEIFFGDN